MGHVLDRGEVGGRMIGSDAAFIVTEDHVHHPVEAVLNGPMTSDDRSDLVSEPDQRGEIEARFALDLVDEFAGALDHDDRFETGPIMAFLQPIDIMEDRVRPGFDTAVVAIDGWTERLRRSGHRCRVTAGVSTRVPGQSSWCVNPNGEQR